MMRSRDLLHLALVHLRRRKARTFLTVAGVIIGTAAIVLMLSLGVSNYSALLQMIEGRASLTEIQVSSENIVLSAADVLELSGIGHVAAASPVLRLPGRLQVDSYEAFVTLTALEPDVLELKLAEGDLFAPGTESPSLVIGGDATRDFIDPADPPNYSDWEEYEAYAPDIPWLEADLRFFFGYAEEPEVADAWLQDPGVPMRVCALTVRSGNMDSTEIYMSLSAAQRLLADHAAEALELNLAPGRFTEALIRVDSVDSVEEVLTAVRDLGFEAYSDIEYVSEMRAEQSRQLLQLLLIGLVSLSVSAIGIANTMYAGILERRRDIGVMKALGMKRKQIRGLFVLEAACVGLIGGLVGLAAALAAVAVINAGVMSGNFLGMYFAEGERISVPLWIAGGAVLVAAGTGILAGLWPAAKAARMSPLEAMRGR